MANVQHSTLTDPNLHEPKGASTALADQVYVADGAGSGSWQILNPYGGIIYNDVAGSGTTFTAPSSYTLINVVTAATNLNGFTTNNAGRLTYTGTDMRHCHAVFDMSFNHSTGAGNNVTFAVYKNGSVLNGYEAIQTADSSTIQRMVLHYDTMLMTNDYFEVYGKTPAGNIVVKQFYLFIMGMPG